MVKDTIKKYTGLAAIVGATAIGTAALTPKTTEYELDGGTLTLSSNLLRTSVEVETSDAYCRRNLLGSKDLDDVYGLFDEGFFREGKTKERSELFGQEYENTYARLACDTALMTKKAEDYLKR